MMMMKLAEATADVDVYLVPANAGGGGGGRGAARGGTGTPPCKLAPPRWRSRSRCGSRPRPRRMRAVEAAPRSAISALANVACYPAINVVNGFTAEHTPTALTFYARPFGERELLAFAKAYQDASGFHLKHPELTA